MNPTLTVDEGAVDDGAVADPGPGATSGSTLPSRGVKVGDAMALAAAIAFSFKAIFVRLALAQGADPVVLLTARMLIAAPFYIVLLLATSRGAGRPTARDGAWIAGMGVIGFALSAALDFQGLAYIGAGLERIILYIHPTLVLLFGAAIARKAPSKKALAATGVAWTGLVVAAGAEVHTGAPADVATGVGLVLACAATYAAYLLVLGHLGPRLGTMRLTASAQVIAAGVLGAWVGAAEPGALAAMSRPVWGLALLLATFGTILPGLLLASAVARVGPGRASTLGMIGPVAATLLAHVLLGEPLSVQQMLGGLVVVGGVAMATRA